MFRRLAISALGAATLLTASLPALAMPLGNGLPVVKTESVQLVGHRHKRRIRNHRRSDRYYYRNRHRRHNNGAAIVAGIIGLGTVLAITNSNRRTVYHRDGYYDDARVYGYRTGSPEWIAACARKYRSFEPRTGLYTTYSGYKRQCRL